jgi:hypothetical protein
MNKFSAPFMQKSPVDEKKKIEKLKEKVEMARRAAFIRSKSESEDHEESPEEKIAQKKYKRLRKKLDKKEQK